MTELNKECTIYLKNGTKFEIGKKKVENATAEVNSENELIVRVYAETLYGARWFKTNYGKIDHIEYKE